MVFITQYDEKHNRQFVSPCGKWVVLPNGTRNGIVVVPITDENILQNAYELKFATTVGKIVLQHEICCWQNDDTLIIRLGLSGKDFTVLFHLNNGAHSSSDAPHMNDRIFCAKYPLSTFIKKG